MRAGTMKAINSRTNRSFDGQTLAKLSENLQTAHLRS